jgi:DNA-binding response OmpR family regulator
MKVLLANDDPVLARTLSAAVVSWGFTAETVPGSQAAGDWLRTALGPCLVVLDLESAGAGNLEIYRRLRGHPDGPPVYCLLLNGSASAAEVLEVLRAGADDCLSKPFGHEDLFARIQVGARVLGLQQELKSRMGQLAEAQARVNHLQALLPICCYCKNVRSDENYWQKVEHYFAEHAAVQFSHGICPNCYHTIVEPALRKHGCVTKRIT